jgi:hypothetical protein
VTSRYSEITRGSRKSESMGICVLVILIAVEPEAAQADELSPVGL